MPRRARKAIMLSVCVFCAWIWWGLEKAAKIIGGAWFVLGLAYLASSTRGFRTAPTTIDLLHIQSDNLD